MAANELNLYRFPWRSCNQFQLLVDGHRFFPAMLTAIGEARRCIILEMYLLESGATLTQFIDALCDAARRGVQIYLLLDDFGARGIIKTDRLRLTTQRNIHLQFYNPLHYGKWRRLLFRDHRKLLLVDGRVAFIGGAGISDHFAGAHQWHDLMVQLEGECVQDWLTLFMDNWPGELEEIECMTALPVTVSDQPTVLGRVVVSQLANRQEIQRSLVRRLKNAEHWVWITTAYFVPSWKLRRALKHAAKRGVDVRLILPGPHTDHPAVRHAGRRFYFSLLRHNVRIFEYQPRFTHAKAYLCDHWCSIGSSNLDRWNLLWNLEGNQEVDDQTFALELKTQLERDLEQCDEISFASWQVRPWHRRLLEWFWGRIDTWLARLSVRKRR